MFNFNSLVLLNVLLYSCASHIISSDDQILILNRPQITRQAVEFGIIENTRQSIINLTKDQGTRTGQWQQQAAGRSRNLLETQRAPSATIIKSTAAFLCGRGRARRRMRRAPAVLHHNHKNTKINTLSKIIIYYIQ